MSAGSKCLENMIAGRPQHRRVQRPRNFQKKSRVKVTLQGAQVREVKAPGQCDYRGCDRQGVVVPHWTAAQTMAWSV